MIKTKISYSFDDILMDKMPVFNASNLFMIIFALNLAYQEMTVREWIREKEINGTSTFSVEGFVLVSLLHQNK